MAISFNDFTANKALDQHPKQKYLMKILDHSLNQKAKRLHRLEFGSYKVSSDETLISQKSAAADMAEYHGLMIQAEFPLDQDKLDEASIWLGELADPVLQPALVEYVRPIGGINPNLGSIFMFFFIHAKSHHLFHYNK